jgi:hypothetical protein
MIAQPEAWCFAEPPAARLQQQRHFLPIGVEAACRWSSRRWLCPRGPVSPAKWQRRRSACPYLPNEGAAHWRRAAELAVAGRRAPSKKFRRPVCPVFWTPGFLIHSLAGAHPIVTVPDATAAWSVIRVRSVVVGRWVVRPCRDCAPDDSAAHESANHRSGTPPAPPRFCFA